ncbi:sugar porter family MFS transporter [Rothia nasimurium]|uniref:sugar porter family MFS transporter n=1 Tax=Rothia nasimurium TaxID=85336 RepID=UPI001EFFFB19|nr:sugar porter family MFS transporter [Rothia nasimurium]
MASVSQNPTADALDHSKEPITGKVIMIAVLAGFSGLLYGFDSGAISGALPQLIDLWGLSDGQVGLVTALLLYGALPSIVGATLASRYIDRRQLLLIAGVIFIVGSIVCAVAPTVEVLMAARFGLGFGIGIANMFGLIYLSELAPTRIRGMLTALYQLAVNFGILGAFTVGDVYQNVEHGWKWMLGLGVVPAVIFFIGMWIAPPSPRFLITRGRFEEARDVLRKLRATEEIADAEALEIQRVASEKNAGIGELFAKARKPLVLLIGLTFFQVYTGINAVVYYAPIIFGTMEGLGERAGMIANYSVGFALVISTAVSLPLIERMGRVKLLAISMAGQAVAMTVLWLFPESGWFTVGAVFAYTFAFGFGLGPVFWLYVPEILPLKMRAIGMGVITFTQYLFNAIFANMVPTWMTQFGSLTFLAFGVLSVVGVLYVIFLIPETTGKSLEEIERELASGNLKA